VSTISRGTFMYSFCRYRPRLFAGLLIGRFMKRGSVPYPNIDKVAGDRRRRRHRGGHEMGAALKTLAAFKVAVRGRGAALARRQPIGIHRQAHRAAGFAPLEPRGEKNRVETLGFRLLLDEARTRHDHAVDGPGDVLARDHLGGGAQILDPSIGAGADKNPIDLNIRDFFTAR